MNTTTSSNPRACYLNKLVNYNINQKNKVKNFRFVDSTQTYRVVIMMSRHWHTDVKTAYYMYSELIYTGKVSK